MIIDLNTYKVNKKHAQEWFLSKPGYSIQDAISNIPMLTGAPCIVAAYWLGEVTGWPEEIKQAIDRLTEFYHYTEILNKPDGCPY